MVEELEVPQQEVKKPIKDLSPEEMKIYNAKKKKESRARQREAMKLSRKQEKSEQDILDMGDGYESAKVHRIREGMCFLGEVSPGVDARTLSEELQVVREMGRAIGEPDVVLGETHIAFVRRIFEAWVSYEGLRGHPDAGGDGGAPFLNRQTGQLSPGWGSYWTQLGFAKAWVAIPGSDKPVSLEAASSFEGDSNG